LEEDVTDNGESGCDLVGAVDEDEMAGGVAGAVQDVEGDGAELELVALGKEAVGADVAGVLDAEARACGFEVVEEEGVALVGAFEGDAGQRVAEGGGAAGVVDVAVGEQDALDRELELLDGGEDFCRRRRPGR